jgi:transposase
MDERLRFVARLLEGEAMTELCREFGISRKTGYKIFGRYKEHGLEALTNRSRRPVRYATQLPPQIETLIVECKRGKPHWGARKLRELLVRRLDGDIRVPAKSTIRAVLDRHGLVKRLGHRGDDRRRPAPRQQFIERMRRMRGNPGQRVDRPGLPNAGAHPLDWDRLPQKYAATRFRLVAMW